MTGVPAKRTQGLTLTRVSRSRKIQHVLIPVNNNIDIIDIKIPSEFFITINTAGVYKYLKKIAVAEASYDKTHSIQNGVLRYYWVGNIEKILKEIVPEQGNPKKLYEELKEVDENAELHEIAEPFESAQDLIISVLRTLPATRFPSRTTTLPTVVFVDSAPLIVPLPDMFLLAEEYISSITHEVVLPKLSVLFLWMEKNLTLDEFREKVIRSLATASAMFWETYDNATVEIAEEEE